MEKAVQPEPRMFVREATFGIIFLVIQFILGMIINLFIEFPTTGPADAWKFAWRSVPVAAHIIIGTVGFLMIVSMLVRSIKRKNSHWITVTSIGVAAMALAVIGGEAFVTTQSEIASFFMSVGFVAAILDLSWGLFKA